MTITAERPVTFPDVNDSPNILDRAQVGELIGGGVTAETVKQYQKESKPGGRYEGNPFPDEDGYFGQTPYAGATSGNGYRRSTHRSATIWYAGPSSTDPRFARSRRRTTRRHVIYTDDNPRDRRWSDPKSRSKRGVDEGS